MSDVPSMPSSQGTDPVWGVLPPRPHPAPPPRWADVCIVGGGISGVATLHWCRAAGLDAVLLEREHLAAGASGRNAGFLLAGVAENYARAVRSHGRALAAKVWAFTLENHRLTRELVAREDAGYRRRGSWTLAGDSEEAASLEEASTLLAEDGLPGRWTGELPPPLAHLRGGLFNPEDGEIDPVRLVAAIAGPHRRHIHEEVEVTALVSETSGVTVVHGAGETLAAARVILATNAYTTELVPEVGIAPIRAQMLATVADPGTDLGPPAYAGWGYRYWRQLADGRVLVGGMRDRARDEEVGTVDTPSPRVQSHLDAELHDLGIAAPVSHRWAGIMGFSGDGLPLVGPVPGRPGVMVLGGYTGHGLGFAVHAARRLAGFLVDGEPLPAWLDRLSSRSTPEPRSWAPGGRRPD
ncbi:MAG: FAD-dependent oxidoreductase [Candidatus Dormiibacterota bacterium]